VTDPPGHVHTEQPVEKRVCASLLPRPCIRLTRVVQAGRGKYRADAAPADAGAAAAAAAAAADAADAAAAECYVPVDCCTFDRVLLYLEVGHGGLVKMTWS